MKKILSLLLVLTLIFALSACGGKDTSSDLSTSTPAVQSDIADDVSEETTADSSVTESTQEEESTQKEESKPAETESSEPTNSSSTPSTVTSKPVVSKPTQVSKITTTVSVQSNSATESSKTTGTQAISKWPYGKVIDGALALTLTDKGVSGLTADRILNLSSFEIYRGYISKNSSKVEKKDWEYNTGKNTVKLYQYAVPEDVVYQYASKLFEIDEATKNTLKKSDSYDSSKGIYWIYDNAAWFGRGTNTEIAGYDSLGNDEYVLYAEAREVSHLSGCAECGGTNGCLMSKPKFKAKVKANGTDGYIFLSFDYIDSIPSNITKIK